MDLHKLKSTISVIESADSNIKSWENLKGRELMVIPTDSEIFKEFNHFIKERRIHYDGKENPQPIYISAMSEEVCQLIIDSYNNFAEPYRNKIEPFLTINSSK